MLTELHIQNFAIIDKLDLRFGAGLIILTGETGAGKSIILDAVVMLIGGKADTTFVRSESDAAFVEGVFQLKGPEREAVHEVLNREELMDDPDYVVLMREVRKEGRSVARINGRTVNVGLLKELGALLIDGSVTAMPCTALRILVNVSLLSWLNPRNNIPGQLPGKSR